MRPRATAGITSNELNRRYRGNDETAFVACSECARGISSS